MSKELIDEEALMLMMSSPQQNSKDAREKKEKKGREYEDVFLKKESISIRRTITISNHTHLKIERILLKVFDNQIPISNYVENILKNHIETYMKDFQERLSKKTNELF